MTRPSSPDQSVSSGLNSIAQSETSLPPSPAILDESSSFGKSSSPQLPTSLGTSFPLDHEPRPQARKSLSSASDSYSSLQQRSRSRDPEADGGQHEAVGTHGDYRKLIYQSFAPRVAVFASSDTEEFVRHKGFGGGLCSLLQPFGECIAGKVTVRDSAGYSRSHDDFGIRFVTSHVLQQAAATSTPWDIGQRNGTSQFLSNPRISADPLVAVEACTKRDINGLIRSYISSADTGDVPRNDAPQGNVYYKNYLRKLLTSAPLVPYETFSHPAACIIVVSSHNPAPIDTLRHLYAQTSRGNNSRLPEWLNTEFLRYYVLIHDDENDDLTTSTALFDLMKRHFGLHCHLLRLKSSRYSAQDSNAVPLPQVSWLPADEEMAFERAKGSID